MERRRIGALIGAAVLVFSFAGVASASDKVCEIERRTSHPTVQTDPCWEQSGEPRSAEPSPSPVVSQAQSPVASQVQGRAPSRAVSPSSEASDEPDSEPSGEPNTEPSAEDSGAVLGETSDSTLPPTDASMTNGQSAPDGTLPLVLLILGAIGLGAVAVNPRRAKR